MDGKENKKSTAVAAAVIIAAAVVLIAVYLVFVLAGGSSPSDTESGSLAPAESFEEESKEVEPPPELSVDGSEKLGDAEIGSLVLFGEYIQLPGSSEDGTSTPVEWIVLDKSEGEVLLVSYRVLFFSRYNSERDTGVTAFSQSTLSGYLNNSFFGSAFSAEERGWISGDEGEKVFILSAEEAGKYFASDSRRTAKATKTANGENDTTNACWWLSDVVSEGFAAYVYTDGSIRTKGYAFDYADVGVRPAIRVSESAALRSIG